jgi:Tetratricopeptide repeat
VEAAFQFRSSSISKFAQLTSRLPRLRRQCRLLQGLAILSLLVGLAAQQAPAQGASAAPNGPVSVQVSPQIFATMCALDAAGFDANVDTIAGIPSLISLRQNLLQLHGPNTEALRQFYKEHALAGSGETLARYIAFALVVGPPPDFQYQIKEDLLPPEVLQLQGFREVLVNFYQEARLDRTWAQFEPAYEQATERYSIPLRRIVTTSNGYLREILKPSTGRTFTIYLEPLVGTRTILRNSGDQYTIVIGLNADIPEDEIQHAYLHYILDPAVLQHRKEVQTKSALLNIAVHAPGLPVEYHDDFLSFADECFVQAVQLRLGNLSSAKLEAALQNSDQAGFILVRPMVQQLRKFEAGGPSMSYYFPDFINGIDVAAEQKRLENFTFSAAASVSVPELARTPATSGASELDVWLAEGDRDIASQNAVGAQATFEKVLAKYPNQPRATYGLAIASVLSGNAPRAEELFSSLVSNGDPGASDAAKPATDPSIVAWSYVYLGRIHDLEDDRGTAMSNYSAALKVAGAPEAARVAAQNGLSAAYQPRVRSGVDK